jgi:hypothetical protein
MKFQFLSVALTGALLLSSQAGATDLLQDDDLDRLSAAGDPTVITSDGATGSSIAYSDDSNFNLTLPKDSQVGLRALTIQNVVGELQLLVNLNVLSATNAVAGTDQRNFSLQSWGSTVPDADTIKTATASAVANAACSVAFSCATPGGIAVGGTGGTGAAGATSTAGATNGSIATGAGFGSGGNTNTNTATADSSGGNGGAGGAASSPAAGNSGIIKGNGAASTSAAVGGTLGSSSGDVILIGKSSGGTSVVAYDNAPTYTFNPASGAQHDLSALFISNVVGRAQMALNLNIAAATLNLTPGADQPFATPFGDATGVIKQVNTGMQFRGTPLPGSTGTTSTFSTTITHTN